MPRYIGVNVKLIERCRQFQQLDLTMPEAFACRRKGWCAPGEGRGAHRAAQWGEAARANTSATLAESDRVAVGTDRGHEHQRGLGWRHH